MTARRVARIIDTHTHGVPCRFPDTAKKAMAALFGTWIATEAYRYVHNQEFTDHTIDGPKGLLASMERANVAVSLLLPVATKPENVDPANQKTMEVVRQHEGKLLSFSAFHPDLADIPGTLARLKAEGYKGVKLHSRRQKFDPLSPKLYKVYEQLQRYGMIVLFDTYNHPPGLTAPKDVLFSHETSTTPMKLARINDDFPQMTIIAAHMGGLMRYDEVEQHLLGRDLYIDTSFAIFYGDREQIIRILRGHRQDRLLFGSDTPAKTQEESIQQILSFDLSLALEQAILHDNAQRLLGLLS